MTTTHRHAAPWTLTRYIADLFSPPTNLPRNARPALLTGREAVARALYSEKVQNSRLDMLDYDSSPRLQAAWLAEADRRIEHAASPDRHVAAHHGISDTDWIHMPSLAKRDYREAFYQDKGLAS